jgi:SAM-dependent methyltransferase
MADAIFDHPRLAAIYDELDNDRSDLDAYVAIAREIGAHRVLDIGCGTGVLALRLADHGIDVTGIDPAGASLDVARAKPGAHRILWINGTLADCDLPPATFDLATMTGNVAQAIKNPLDWSATLRSVRGCLRPGGLFVFETRVPSRRAWEDWNRNSSRHSATLSGGGEVESWVDLLEVAGPLVTFQWTYVFDSDQTMLTSISTLRFREKDEVEADLDASGLLVDEIRDAPDRPGLEYVFLARSPSEDRGDV